MNVIEYRVENKYIVSQMDIINLSEKLYPVMLQDIHQQDGCYEIRSIYFDDLYDNCMDENEAGCDSRKKYRIRRYDTNTGLLNLEIKEKKSGLTKKTSCKLSRKEYEAIMYNSEALAYGEKKTLNQFLLAMKCAGMQPKAIIKYERTAFVHPSGNVRITFDRNIMASSVCDSFLEEDIPKLIPVLPAGMHILEVKYDEMLPDMIARQLEIGKLQQTAFSKYYLGRLAVNGEFPYLR